MKTYELNIDGLVGPTHHYAGLSAGNIASIKHAKQISNPRQAALQGLEKMKLLLDLGIKQAILPPHPRPNLHLLHQLGFTGSPSKQIEKAHQQAPRILSAAYSASSMWTANAATVTPSADSEDHKVHFTPANLISNLHRAQEGDYTAALLQKIFNHNQYFIHNPVLPKTTIIGDEGAANHMRLSLHHQISGINIFVYNKSAFNKNSSPIPQKFPSRQTFEASESVCRSHQLPSNKVLYIQQRAQSVDAGVFHNDVIAVSNEDTLFIHEHAWEQQANMLSQLKKNSDFKLHIIQVPDTAFTVEDAVMSYVFNSQLITLPSESMALIAPEECQHMPKIKQFLDIMIASPSNRIEDIYFLDLKQSMQNGGGPACLRLRVVLTEEELAHVHQPIIMTEDRIQQLQAWVKKYYRDRLCFDDLRDPGLIAESYSAIEALERLLQLKLL